MCWCWNTWQMFFHYCALSDWYPPPLAWSHVCKCCSCTTKPWFKPYFLAFYRWKHEVASRVREASAFIPAWGQRGRGQLLPLWWDFSNICIGSIRLFRINTRTNWFMHINKCTFAPKWRNVIIYPNHKERWSLRSFSYHQNSIFRIPTLDAW